MATKRGPKPKKAPISQGKPVETLTIPEHLTGRVREEYARVAERLHQAGKLDATDPRLIELYAVNYDLVRAAKDELDRDGLTFSTEKGIYPHPMVGVLNAATIRLRGLIADLEGVKPSGDTKPTQGESRWAGLLSVTG